MSKKLKREDSGMDDLISIADAARLRGVSHAAIRNLIDRGRLPAQEVAGRRVVRRGDVMGFKAEMGGRGRKATGTDGQVKVGTSGKR